MTRRYLVAGILGFIIVGLAIGFWAMKGPEVLVRDLSGLSGDVNRGAYITRLSGCIGCHSDAKSGRGVLAGGAAIPTEFGTFYAPNITPHAGDGIGGWTLNDFAKAVTQGISPEGHHFFPAFPYAFYTNLTNQDVVDLWAAVQSVPAVAGGPPSHDLRFPFGFRKPIGFWKRLFFTAGPIEPVGERSASWNRGRYLAFAAGHCGACHTPRNALGGREIERRYQGGIGPKNEKIPAITPDALQKNKWTIDDLRYALRTGITPKGDVFGGSMAEVIREGTRFWSDGDIAAIAEFLFSPDGGHHGDAVQPATGVRNSSSLSSK